MHFDSIIEKVRESLRGWKAKMLSSGVWLLLIKHVIQGMPIHLLSVLNTLKQVINKLHSLMSTFFLGKIDGKPKRRWYAWREMCKPVAEGGLGIRNLYEVQQSLHMKLAWSLISQSSLWANFFSKKYVAGVHITEIDATKGTNF